MGVPNHSRYKATDHAKERYWQRIDATKTETDVVNEFKRILHNARFLSKEYKGRESWLCEIRDVVVIIDPRKYSIVTIYRSVDEYDSAEQTKAPANEIHPKVQTIIANSARTAYVQQEKSYFARLAPMYKEYGDRIDKLSRTKKTEYFENKKIELDDLQKEISQLVAEKNRVLKDLKSFMKE